MVEKPSDEQYLAGCFCILLMIGAAVILIVAVVSTVLFMFVASVLLIALSALGLYYILIVPRRRYWDRLRRERSDYTVGDFLGHFETLGLRGEAVRIAYESLQPWSPLAEVSILPTDSLESDLGMVVHEEVDDILQACTCREPTDEEWELPVDTVEDLVVLISRLYTGKPQSWPSWYELPWSPGARIFGIVMLAAFLQFLLVGATSLIAWASGMDGVVVDRVRLVFFALAATGLGYCIAYGLVQLLSDRAGLTYLLSRGTGIFASASALIVGFLVLVGLIVFLPSVMSLLGLLFWVALIVPLELLVFVTIVRRIESWRGS